ncbi:MAG: hypothetical protein ACREP2_13840 [Rhodanobacteraceae bacterium]
MNADEDTLFNLIAAVNDHRRFLEAAALRSGDPARRAQCQRQSRTQAMTVSKITRDLARHRKCHAPLSSRELEDYVDSLIDAYSDDSSDPFAASGAVPKAPLRRHDRL